MLLQCISCLDSHVLVAMFYHPRFEGSGYIIKTGKVEYNLFHHIVHMNSFEELMVHLPYIVKINTI